MKNDVSLWLGRFSDFDELETYTEIKYNVDGDSIPSIFEKDFKLGYYDRDLVEKDWITDAEDDIEKLLVDFSYDNQLIQQYINIKLKSKYNTIILIYNYDYNKEGKIVKLVDNNTCNLDFIGTAEYID
ncbi:immunity 22 family protein [Sporosarcina sp. FSL K6-6792]|uniref:immunity 22 family protein n=1 Tax=Sporosarcina sp. FSL K6-6792 TaxID=2921559 RepID=UPI0030F5BE23